jgi:hypothetical protein
MDQGRSVGGEDRWFAGGAGWLARRMVNSTRAASDHLVVAVVSAGRMRTSFVVDPGAVAVRQRD